MNNYRFQEVLCLFCNKSYMTSIHDVHNTVVKHDGQTMSGWMDGYLSEMRFVGIRCRK